MFLRTFACAALTATIAVAGAVPAAATASTACVHSGSTRLFTANDGEYKVWIDEIRSSSGWEELHLCFAAGGVLAGDLIVREPLGGTLVPTVTPDLTDEACPRLVHLQDPVELMTRFAESLSSTPAYLCFGVGDEAYRVTFTAPAPAVSPRTVLYLDKGTALTDAYCSVSGDVDCTNTALTYVRVV